MKPESHERNPLILEDSLLYTLNEIYKTTKSKIQEFLAIGLTRFH